MPGHDICTWIRWTVLWHVLVGSDVDRDPSVISVREPCKLPVAAVQLNSSVREQNNTEDLFLRLNARHRWHGARLIRRFGVRTYKLENDKDK